MDPTALQELAREIEREYEADFLRRPFPLAELLALKSIDPLKWIDLHSYLDLDCADVAGYCSRATRLQFKGADGIAKVRADLALPFFDKHPELLAFKSHIDMERTPELFRRLELMERRRSQLLEVLETSG